MGNKKLVLVKMYTDGSGTIHLDANKPNIIKSGINVVQVLGGLEFLKMKLFNEITFGVEAKKVKKDGKY